MKNRTAPMRLVFAAALLFTSASASLGASPDFSDMQKRLDEAAKQGRIVYSEKGFTLNQTYHPPGRLSEVSFKGAAVHGATTKTNLEAGYPPGTVLEVEGRLTVAKGSYKAVFKNKDQDTLTLAAKNGSKSEARGLVSVDSHGKLPFDVVAEQAENITLTLKIKPAGKP